MKEWLETHSWKTTSIGLVSIIGGIVRIAFMVKNGAVTEEGIMTTVTTILGGIGFLVARDNDKTSEDVTKKDGQ